MKAFKFTDFAVTLILFTLTFLNGCSDDDSPSPAEDTYEAGLQFYEMTWEGRSRTYQVYFPLAEFSEQNLPLLFVLHGGGGNATNLQSSTFNRFNELADSQGFIVVYPEGFEKQWNDGRDVTGIATAWDENIDDVGFISEIVSILNRDYNIESNRIFTSGISNGGFMSSRLLCDRADLFRGGAIITATIPASHFSVCDPSSSNSVLVLNGTEDPLVPYQGGQITVLGQERGLIISTEAYMEFWAENAGCNSNPSITDLPDMEDDGTTVQIYEYADCDNQAVVRLYRIEGGGHTWPGAREDLPEALVGRTSKEFVACDVIWDFFDNL